MNALSIVISTQNLLNKPYTEMVTLNGGFCEEEALAQKMQAWEEYKVCQKGAIHKSRGQLRVREVVQMIIL